MGQVSDLLIISDEGDRIYDSRLYIRVSFDDAFTLSQLTFQEIVTSPAGDITAATSEEREVMVVKHDGTEEVRSLPTQRLTVDDNTGRVEIVQPDESSLSIFGGGDLFDQGCPYLHNKTGRTGFEVVDVELGDINDEPGKEIVVAANPLSHDSPSLILSMSADGEVLDAYCHLGTIHAISVIESDTGLPGVVVARGENSWLGNAFGPVVFGLSRPDFDGVTCWTISGVDSTGYSVPAGCPLDQSIEIFYRSLLPRDVAIERMQTSVVDRGRL